GQPAGGEGDLAGTEVPVVDDRGAVLGAESLLGHVKGVLLRSWVRPRGACRQPVFDRSPRAGTDTGGHYRGPVRSRRCRGSPCAEALPVLLLCDRGRQEPPPMSYYRRRPSRSMSER